MNDLVAIALGAAVGAAAAQLAHATDGYYHDAVRPLARDLRNGASTRREVAHYAWGVSRRFIFFMAAPFAILSGAVVSHMLFLSAEVLALRAARRLVALLAGGLVGAATVAAAIFGRKALDGLGIEYEAHLAQLVEPVLWLYPVIPALAATKLPAPVRGTIATALAGGAVAGGVALAGWDGAVAPAAVAAATLALTAFQLARAPAPARAPDIPHVAERRGVPALLVVAAGVAALAAASRLAGDPLAALLIAEGHMADAATVALLVMLSYVPLVAISTTSSDSHSTQGTADSIPAVGYVLAGLGPIAAAAGGVVAMLVEIAAKRRTMQLVMRRPVLSESASALRDAIGDVMLLALLVGGLALAAGIAGPIGFLVAGAAWLLNEQAGCPVTRLAVTPMAAIAAMLGAELWRVLA
ncbi:MAG TPA: YhfT family protein [Conexibacter sp.]